MNYLLPVIKYSNDDDLHSTKMELDNILTQQIIISQLSNGITYQDTENMDSYERNFIFKKLVQMEQEKNDAKLKAIENAKQNR